MYPDDNADTSVPPLPMDRAWRDEVIESWIEWHLWPQASQWLPVDRQALLMVAHLLQDAYEAGPSLRVRILAELRQQAAEFGFSLMARARLH